MLNDTKFGTRLFAHSNEGEIVLYGHLSLTGEHTSMIL